MRARLVFRSLRIAPVYFDGIVTSRFDDRLQQHRPGFAEGLLERHAAGGLERGFRAVDGVVLAEIDLDRHVLDAIAGEGALFQAPPCSPSPRRG